MFIEWEVGESEQGKGKIIALCTTLDSWDYFFPLVWEFACNIFNLEKEDNVNRQFHPS